jgi:diguanylate cyclase (GGDEF)-like protein
MRVSGSYESASSGARTSFWTRPCKWACGTTYPLVGALLALGSPVGYLGVRLIAAGGPITLSAIGAEVASNPLTYAYLMTSALVTFVLLGWVLGRKEDALQRASATDPLTGLWNRRHFHARLAEEVARASRNGEPLALLMIDLDRLKTINDRSGHGAGDRALRRVASALRRTCRATDVAARYGGDEFIVLAPGASAAQAMELAERIRAAARKDDPVCPISVSIGITDLDRAGALTGEALRDSADRALYAAKSAGRDRATLASAS